MIDGRFDERLATPGVAFFSKQMTSPLFFLTIKFAILSDFIRTLRMGGTV